jgi:hypothetical protein
MSPEIAKSKPFILASVLSLHLISIKGRKKQRIKIEKSPELI